MQAAGDLRGDGLFSHARSHALEAWRVHQNTRGFTFKTTLADAPMLDARGDPVPRDKTAQDHWAANRAALQATVRAGRSTPGGLVRSRAV